MDLNENHVSEIACVFFSGENVDLLQKILSEEVRKACGRQIGRQSDKELMVVMRSIYFSHCKHLPGDVRRQVRQLNDRVLEYAVENVLEEIRMRDKFVDDLTQPRDIMPHSANVNVKGHRSLNGMIR
jgi:hypothetical protein